VADKLPAGERTSPYSERRRHPLPGQPGITVGLRVPHELAGGAAGLRDFASRAEAAGIDRLFTGDHVTFRGGHGVDGRPYVDAGCRSFNLIPAADSEQAAIEGAAAVRELLRENA
jgi:hypothetical protein